MRRVELLFATGRDIWQAVEVYCKLDSQNLMLLNASLKEVRPNEGPVHYPEPKKYARVILPLGPHILAVMEDEW